MNKIISNNKILIRNEEEKDYKEVETVTREAFYNIYVPGCYEHYLVHIMRQHEDFVEELDFVVEVNGEIIGNIMYTKSKLVARSTEIKEILTLGPLCIKPEFQRNGYGKLLLEHSFNEAIKLGYDVIVLFGIPSNYVSSGFKSSKQYNVSLEDNIFPTAMMIKELKQGILKNESWFYYDSPIMHFDKSKAQLFDDNLVKIEKKHLVSQEEFYIIANSFIK